MIFSAAAFMIGHAAGSSSARDLMPGRSAGNHYYDITASISS
jgi:hypothetical protein